MVKRQKNRKHNGQKREEQTTQWSKDRRTDNTMVNRQEQTTLWSKDRRTDNTMVKRQKIRQHNGQKKKYNRTNNHLQNIHIK